MKHLLAAIGSIVVGLASFFFLYSESQNLILALSLSGIVLLYAIFLAFGEKKLFPELKADVILLGALFGLLGIAIAGYPASLLSEYGYRAYGITLIFLFFVTNYMRSN